MSFGAGFNQGSAAVARGLAARAQREKVERERAQQLQQEQVGFLDLLVKNSNIKGDVLAPVVAPNLSEERVRQTIETAKVLRNEQQRREQGEAGLETLKTLRGAVDSPHLRPGEREQAESQIIRTQDLVRSQLGEQAEPAFQRIEAESIVGALESRAKRRQELADDRLKLQQDVAKASVGPFTENASSLFANDPSPENAARIGASIEKIYGPHGLSEEVAAGIDLRAGKEQQQSMTVSDWRNIDATAPPSVVKSAVAGKGFEDPWVGMIASGAPAGQEEKTQKDRQSVLLSLQRYRTTAQKAAELGFSLFGRTATFQEIQRRLGGSRHPLMASLQTQSTLLLKALARATEPGGRLTDQDIEFIQGALPIANEVFITQDGSLNPAVTAALDSLESIVIDEYGSAFSGFGRQRQAKDILRDEVLPAIRDEHLDLLDSVPAATSVVSQQGASAIAEMEAMVNSQQAAGSAAAGLSQRR